jgi:hypothetical protein
MPGVDSSAPGATLLGMKALVCVMNARDIPECMDSYRRLTTDVAYMTGYTIAELVPIHAEIIRTTDYDAYINVSDDCVVTQSAVDAVVDLLASGHPAVTGWCRLRKGSPLANLSDSPLVGAPPDRHGFDFPSVGRVRKWPDKIYPTHFMGMALTGLTREMWERFPYGCWKITHDRGHGSDTHLSTRLRDAGIPMVCARDGYVEHMKEHKQDVKRFPMGKGRTRLLIGQVPQTVTLQTKRVIID